MTPGNVVGWIVVVGFAATLIITLLAMIKLIPMDPKYLSKLFVVLVVELIGSAFWLFNQEFRVPAPQFEPSLAMGELYLFDSTGTPLRETRLILGADTLRTFNSQPAAFEIERGFEVRDSELLIKGQGDDFQLGTIKLEDLSREAEDSLLSFETHLNLGLHYAECLDGPACRQRNDAARAIPHLFASLADDSQTDTHERAVVQLFHLKERLRTCQEFIKLAGQIGMHRPVPYRYIELGDLYQAMALNLNELNSESRSVARRLALKQFLRFLSVPQVDSASELFLRANDEAKSLATFLFGNNSDVQITIDSSDKQEFARVADSIEASLACAGQA